MSDAHVEFEKRLVNDFVSKKHSGIFRYIRSLSGKPTIPSVMSLSNCKADTPYSVASLFNWFFHSIFNTCSTSLLNPPLFLPENSICSIEISLHDTFQALASLQTNKAMGGDGIPPSFSEKQLQLSLNHYIIFFFSVFNNLRSLLSGLTTI